MPTCNKFFYMLMTKFKNIIGRIGMSNTTFTHYTTTVKQ